MAREVPARPEQFSQALSLLPTMGQRRLLLCLSQSISMPKLAPRFAVVQVVALLLFTVASRAQSTDPQLPATRKPQPETIKIKLVDGRNGHPMAGKASYVNVWVGTERKDAITIPTDVNGIASLQLTLNTAEINIPNLPSERGSIVVTHPIVKYNESLRINVPYALCQLNGGEYSWLKTMELSTSRVLQKGTTMANTCGKPIAAAKPGEVIIFVRPLTWCEKLKQ